MSQSTTDPRNLVFEFGFDWDANPSARFHGGVYQLQVYLVDGDQLASAANPSDIGVDDVLSFKVYDFSSQTGEADANPSPAALQLLFTEGVTTEAEEEGRKFSPIWDKEDQQVSQLIFTEFSECEEQSRAFGVTRGWEVTMEEDECKLRDYGRFEFRALLTLSNPGKPARFYRVDPEMVVGAAGGGSDR